MISSAKISRRSLLLGLTAVGTATIARATTRPVRVAALQIHPKLADVGANLERAERLIRRARDRVVAARQREERRVRRARPAVGRRCHVLGTAALPDGAPHAGISGPGPNRVDWPGVARLRRSSRHRARTCNAVRSDSRRQLLDTGGSRGCVHVLAYQRRRGTGHLSQAARDVVTVGPARSGRSGCPHSYQIVLTSFS